MICMRYYGDNRKVNHLNRKLIIQCAMYFIASTLFFTSFVRGDRKDDDLVILLETMTGTDATLRDSSGKLTARSDNNGDRTVIRDAGGRTEYVVEEHGNRLTIRDSSGRLIATGQKSGNEVVYRDGSGKTISRVNSSDHQTDIRDSSGRKTATISKSGNEKTVRDAGGRTEFRASE